MTARLTQPNRARPSRSRPISTMDKNLRAACEHALSSERQAAMIFSSASMRDLKFLPFRRQVGRQCGGQRQPKWLRRLQFVLIKFAEIRLDHAKRGNSNIAGLIFCCKIGVGNIGRCYDDRDSDTYRRRRRCSKALPTAIRAPAGRWQTCLNVPALGLSVGIFRSQSGDLLGVIALNHLRRSLRLALRETLLGAGVNGF